MNIIKKINYLNELSLKEDEKIKQIKNFPKYYISNYGYVLKEINRDSDHKYKKTHWKILKNHFIKTSGYFDIQLTNEKEKKHFLINRLVAIYFIKNPYNYPIVDHIDNNKLNNYYKNLQWCSYSFNNKKTYKDNLRSSKKGKDNISSKKVLITNLNTNEKRIFYSLNEASRELNIRMSTLSRNANNGKIYKEYLKVEFC